jgi:hypothetical protein
MTKLTQVGESIEGQSLSLQTRKFLARPPERDSVLGAIVYPFKLGIFGLATVVLELNPKKAIWAAASKLDLGDELHAEAIYGKCEKPLAKPRVAAATGTHRAAFLTTKGRSFAKIEVGVRALLQKKQLAKKTSGQ